MIRLYAEFSTLYTMSEAHQRLVRSQLPTQAKTVYLTNGLRITHAQGWYDLFYNTTREKYVLYDCREVASERLMLEKALEGNIEQVLRFVRGSLEERI